MTETTHIEQEQLLDYLYGEADASARARVEEHTRSCPQCAAEVGELRNVRATLGEWGPPEAELGFRLVSKRDEASFGPAPPSWAARTLRPRMRGLAAAAVLVLQQPEHWLHLFDYRSIVHLLQVYRRQIAPEQPLFGKLCLLRTHRKVQKGLMHPLVRKI